MLADVLRGKTSGLSLKMLPGYLFHGVFAVLALWMLIRALQA
jgi:hypothetical protein